MFSKLCCCPDSWLPSTETSMIAAPCRQGGRAPPHRHLPSPTSRHNRLVTVSASSQHNLVSSVHCANHRRRALQWAWHSLPNLSVFPDVFAACLWPGFPTVGAPWWQARYRHIEQKWRPVEIYIDILSRSEDLLRYIGDHGHTHVDIYLLLSSHILHRLHLW
jgi:hypothetical protein